MRPALRTAEIIPTDAADMAPPEVEKLPFGRFDKRSGEEASRRRAGGACDLREDDVNVRATRNALLPILTLSGEYATEGLAGNSRLITTCTPVPPGHNLRSTAANVHRSGNVLERAIYRASTRNITRSSA